MADIPYTRPETFDIAQERPQDFNSEAVGRGLEEVGGLFEKLDALKRSKQMADGELATDQFITAGMTKIQEGKDYDNGPLHFANVIEQQKQAIQNSDYEDPVKQHLLHDLGMKQAQYGAQVAAWSYSGQMTNAKDSLNTYVTTKRDQYANAGSDFERAQIKAGVQAMVQSNVGTMLTQQSADDVMQKVNEEYDDNAAALDITKDAAGTLKKLRDSKQYQGLDGKQRAEYIDRATNQIKQAQEANAAVAEGAAKDQIDSALTYGKYDVAKFQNAIKGLKPEMQAIANSRLKLSLDAYTSNIAIQTGTPDERTQALKRYEPQPGEDDFAFREGMYEKMQDTYNDVNQKLTTDPASVVQDRIDRSLPIPQQIEQSMALQKQMGAIAPRVLTTDKAKDYAGQYDSAPPDQKGAFVAALKVKTGPYFGQVAAEMYKQGMKPSFMFADRGVDVLSKLAVLDETGEEKLKQGIGEPAWKSLSDGVDGQDEFLRKITPPGAPDQLAQAKGTFLKLAAFYKGKGDADPIGHAQKDLFGDYTISGNWTFPSNVTGGLQDNVQDYYTKFITDLPDIAAPPGMDPNEFKSIVLAQAKPVLSSDKFHYSFYLNGDKVRYANGKPVVMNLADGVQYQGAKALDQKLTDLESGKIVDNGITSLGP